MKASLLGILCLVVSVPAYSCSTGLIRTWVQGVGYSCVSRLSLSQQSFAALACANHTGEVFDSSAFNTFYGPSYRGGSSPWWASQGQVYYPNMYYPGAWNYPHITSSYYPGQGGVFAAKPNVYIESIHDNKKFEFKFTSKEKLSFLVTTPPLEEDKSWKGRIHRDKFAVEEVFYDYLFYDIRLEKEKMQFEAGLCATRDGAIEWMLGDLKEMNYSPIALQDFEEHWRVKIPDYPFFCIYPQYNKVLDEALPVSVDLPQSTFIRSLYVLVPHKKELDPDHPSGVPYPRKDPKEFRPSAKITRENMFREWGVAFLGN